jgi:hypothetical protein
MRFAFEDEDVVAACVGKMPSNAGADDTSTDDDDFCSFHDGDIVEQLAISNQQLELIS